MKKAIGITIVSLLLLSGIAMSTEVKDIQDFKVIQAFPINMTAGSTYEAHYIFKCTNSVPIYVNISISHPLIENGEWHVSITLDDDKINCTEVSAGNFSTRKYLIYTGEHTLKINVSSLPNILPETYNITMELWSLKVRIYPPPSVGSDYKATPTPSPTPTVTPTPTPTVIPTVTPTITPTVTPTPTPISLIQRFLRQPIDIIIVESALVLVCLLAVAYLIMEKRQ